MTIKRISNFITAFGVAVFIAVSAIGVSSIVTGCKTAPSVSQVTYNTLDGVGASVDAAMKVAANLRVSGKIDAPTWQSIADKHALFVKSYDAACDAAAVILDKAQAPADLVALASDLTGFIATFNK